MSLLLPELSQWLLNPLAVQQIKRQASASRAWLEALQLFSSLLRNIGAIDLSFPIIDLQLLIDPLNQSTLNYLANSNSRVAITVEKLIPRRGVRRSVLGNKEQLWYSNKQQIKERISAKQVSKIEVSRENLERILVRYGNEVATDNGSRKILKVPKKDQPFSDLTMIATPELLKEQLPRERRSIKQLVQLTDVMSDLTTTASQLLIKDEEINELVNMNYTVNDLITTQQQQSAEESSTENPVKLSDMVKGLVTSEIKPTINNREWLPYSNEDRSKIALEPIVQRSVVVRSDVTTDGSTFQDSQSQNVEQAVAKKIFSKWQEQVDKILKEWIVKSPAITKTVRQSLTKKEFEEKALPLIEFSKYLYNSETILDDTTLPVVNILSEVNQLTSRLIDKSSTASVETEQMQTYTVNLEQTVAATSRVLTEQSQKITEKQLQSLAISQSLEQITAQLNSIESTMSVVNTPIKQQREEQPEVQWLTDEELADRLQKVLKRQARRKGIII
ncbi:MAG: hypothetical protein AB1489_38370 [Acidobacteriota bacterium]